MTSFVTAVDLEVAVSREVLLASVSFELQAGQALAVTGSNGSGKTTLLRVVAGLAPPSTGSVTVAGDTPNLQDPTFRGRVAALLGLPPMARNLTLREHLVLVGASWGFTLGEAGTRADGLLGEFGISRLASRFPHELSSGQTQLFALALTLSRTFEVLLLDEPEQRLDTDRLSTVGGILRGLVDRGTTIVMASHNQQLVSQVADRTLTISEAVHDGRE